MLRYDMSSLPSSMLGSSVQALRQIVRRCERATQNKLMTMTVIAPKACQPMAGWPMVYASRPGSVKPM